MSSYVNIWIINENSRMVLSWFPFLCYTASTYLLYTYQSLSTVLGRIVLIFVSRILGFINPVASNIITWLTLKLRATGVLSLHGTLIRTGFGHFRDINNTHSSNKKRYVLCAGCFTKRAIKITLLDEYIRKREWFLQMRLKKHYLLLRSMDQ